MDVCSVLITGQAFIFCGFSDKRIWVALANPTRPEIGTEAKV